MLSMGKSTISTGPFSSSQTATNYQIEESLRTAPCNYDMQISIVMFQCAKDSDASDSMQQQLATAKSQSQNWFKDKF